MLPRLSLSTKQLLHSHFNTIVRIIQKMEPNHPGLFSKAHFPSQLIANNNANSDLYNTSYFVKERFVGEGLCGEAIYACKYIIENHGIGNELQIKVWRNTYGSGRRANDHCFLTISPKETDDPTQTLIIDPTAKQFWKKDSSLNSADSADMYTIYLQCLLPPFFVGTEEDLKTTICNLRNVYDTPPHHLKSDETPCFETRYWNPTEDITHKFDLSKCLSDYNYFKEKPYEYQVMVKKLARVVYGV